MAPDVTVHDAPPILRAGSGARPLMLLGALLLASLAGCTTTIECRIGPAANPAALVHVVLFDLDDAFLADELAADCERLLKPLPMVHGFSVGRHVDTGREGVQSDYDLALVVRFVDERAYQAYAEHPSHLELVAIWKPHLSGLRRYDFWDEELGPQR